MKILSVNNFDFNRPLIYSSELAMTNQIPAKYTFQFHYKHANTGQRYAMVQFICFDQITKYTAKYCYTNKNTHIPFFNNTWLACF